MHGSSFDDRVSFTATRPPGRGESKGLPATVAVVFADESVVHLERTVAVPNSTMGPRWPSSLIISRCDLILAVQGIKGGAALLNKPLDNIGAPSIDIVIFSVG